MADEPRILFISRAYPPDLGGIQTHNHDLAAALSRIADVTIISNGRGKKQLPWFLPYAALRAVALAPRYDAVLLGDGVLGVVGWLLKKLRPRMCVASAVHGLDLTWTPAIYQSLWVRRFLPALDLLVAVSAETRRVAEERGLDPARVVVVPNGVDAPPAPPADREGLAAVIGRPLGSSRLVLSLGRLVPRKGFAWFARNVMPLLPADVLYLVAGDGPEREQIAEAASAADVADRVLLLGAVDERTREALLATSDVFVQPNVPVAGDMEGFGIVVLEAGAAGLPVVASGLEGLKDAVREGVNGLLVPPCEPEACAAAVRGLLDDESARRALGESAERYVREELTWSAIARRYLDAIEECIGRAGRR